MTRGRADARGYARITMVIIITVLYSDTTTASTVTPNRNSGQNENKASERARTIRKCNDTIDISSVCKERQPNYFSCEAETGFTVVDFHNTGALLNVTIHWKKNQVEHIPYCWLNVIKATDAAGSSTNTTVLVNCSKGNVIVDWRGTRMTFSRNDSVVKCMDVPSVVPDGKEITTNYTTNSTVGSNTQPVTMTLHFDVLVAGLVAVCGVGILTLAVTVAVAIKHVTSGNQQLDDKGLEGLWVSDTQRDTDYDPMVHQPQYVFPQGNGPDQHVGSNPNLAADEPLDRYEQYVGSNQNLAADEIPMPPPPPPPPPPPEPPSPPLSTGPDMVYADLELEEPCAKDFVHVPRHACQTEYVTIDFNTRNPCITLES